MIQRAEIKKLIERLKEPRKFIQVIVGPRQIGKTTMVSQAMEQIDIPHLFFSADNIFAPDFISLIANTSRCKLSL